MQNYANYLRNGMFPLFVLLFFLQDIRLAYPALDRKYL